MKPWFEIPHNINLTKKVIIIGAGISGAATAYSLAKRGYKVTVYEANKRPAMEASGNNQAILFANFSGNNLTLLELHNKGYQYSVALIKQLLKIDDDYSPSGVIQLAYNERQIRQQQQILNKKDVNNILFVDKDKITQLAGVEVNCNSGLHYTQGLWFNPPSLIKQLLNHPNITLVLDTIVSQIRYNNGWSVHTDNKELDNAPNLVICNSHALQKFDQLAMLAIIKTRGQISQINNTLNLKTVICASGYITPNRGASYTIGATFKPGDIGKDIRLEEHRENIDTMLPYIAQLGEQVELNNIQGRANIRASCNDYLPLTGPIADYTKFMLDYQGLAKDANYKIDTPCPYQPGLYINAAHGAKGMLSAPYCGEIIANYISNTQFENSEDLRCALHPNRLWLKQIIKSAHLKGA